MIACGVPSCFNLPQQNRACTPLFQPRPACDGLGGALGDGGVGIATLDATKSFTI